MVVLHCPLEILRGGLDLYDGPGTSCTDADSVQEILKQFLAHANPMIIFVYANPV